MPSQVNVYTIAEMNSRAEDAVLKVQQELFRLGCNPEEIRILKQGYYLQLRYGQQIILVDPGRVLFALQDISVGSDEAEVWQKIVSKVRQVRKHSTRQRAWRVAVLVVPLLLALLWVLFQVGR